MQNSLLIDRHPTQRSEGTTNVHRVQLPFSHWQTQFSRKVNTP